MAKRTATKIARTHEKVKDKHGVTTLEKRKETLPPAETRYRPCGVCHHPMPVGQGQLAKYHALCRKYRHSIQRSTITPSKKILSPSR